MDLSQAEILFAQKLACGEPRTRKKAFAQLEKWIRARSAKGKLFTEEDFAKLWKGLYYAMWLQDKPLLQEELTENVTDLINRLTDDSQKLLFLETFLQEMAKQWFILDQWRMDKFMMFYRRFFRKTLAWMKQAKWKKNLLDSIFNVLEETVWSACPESYPEGLKIHFASIYLDELDNAAAGDLSDEQTFRFLLPYIDLLQNKQLSDIFFDTIIEEIFKLLLQFSAELLDRKTKKKYSDKPLPKFDLPKIRSALFEIGKQKSTTKRRRCVMYDYVKKFDVLIAGFDPFVEEIADVDELSDEDIENAARSIIKLSAKTPKRKRKSDEMLDDLSETDEEITPERKRPKKVMKKKSKLRKLNAKPKKSRKVK